MKTNNPYLQSRLLWDELYGNTQTRLENSYRMIWLLVMSVLATIAGIIYVSTQSQIKPYVAVIRDNDP